MMFEESSYATGISSSSRYKKGGKDKMKRLRKKSKKNLFLKEEAEDGKHIGNVFKTLLQEMNHALNINEVEDDEEENTMVDYELEQLVNMFRIPVYLEKFMILTLLASFDCFLYYFTILPVRLVHGIVNSLAQLPNRRRSRTRKERLIVFLILTASVILSKVDTSKVYHMIKRQSAVKLYMLYGVLDMADKMLSTLGQSLLIVVLSRGYQRRQRLQQAFFTCLSLTYLVAHGYVLIYQTVALNVAVNSYSNSLLTLLLSVQFSEIKSSIFKKFDKEGLFQITIADVVERFQVIVLLLIIAIRNLVAKSGSISAIIPNSWTLHSTSSIVIGVLCGPVVSVIGSELIVDWAKHAYITKFNRIRPTIYDKFFYIIYKDHVSGLQKYQDRLGLPLPALTVLTLVMIRPTLLQALPSSSVVFSIIIVCISFILLILMKYTLHLTLLRWGKVIRKTIIRSRLDSIVTENEYVPGMLGSGLGKVDEPSLRIMNVGEDDRTKHYISKTSSSEKRSHGDFNPPSMPLNLNEVRKERNEKKPNSLEEVARYKMVSKRIW